MRFMFYVLCVIAAIEWVLFLGCFITLFFVPLDAPKFTYALIATGGWGALLTWFAIDLHVDVLKAERDHNAT